jgi:hypothetical protein
MIDIQSLTSSGNYVEILLLEKKDSQDISDKHFFKLIESLKKSGYSSFQKHYKEYVYRNMIYENNEKSQIKVFKNTFKKTQNISPNIIANVFYKEKVPYHMFPSTKLIYSVSYVSKLIFKVNNRIFINFEKRKYDTQANSNVSFNKVYINYNHDDNVDLTNIQDTLVCVMDYIK